MEPFVCSIVLFVVFSIVVLIVSSWLVVPMLWLWWWIQKMWIAKMVILEVCLCLEGLWVHRM